MTERALIADVDAVLRAYTAGFVTEEEAVSFLRPIADGERHFPLCKHGLHSGVLINGVAACPLCVVQWQERNRE